MEAEPSWPRGKWGAQERHPPPPSSAEQQGPGMAGPASVEEPVLLSKGLEEDRGLEGIMLSGISQTEKGKSCRISVTFGVEKSNQTIKNKINEQIKHADRERSRGCLRGTQGGQGGYRGQLHDDGRNCSWR